MMNLVPFILVGAFVVFGGKKKKKKKRTGPKAISAGRGTVFSGEGESAPAAIEARVGERFSISFARIPMVSGTWTIKASPVDNSIRHISTEQDDIASNPSTRSGETVFIFEGASPGKGSLVFHYQDPKIDGRSPPAKVAEFLTEII